MTSTSYEAAVRALVAARKRTGLSQRDLAAAIGKPRSFVSKFENRERRLDVVEFIAVANGLGLDPGSLILEVADAMPSPLEF